ncbi:MAG: dockerin type I repeat-containing protein [Christensenellaceae bacterium]|nr:dockerin type I repeat-containing protein [Christensenellaceae bacterium]
MKLCKKLIAAMLIAAMLLVSVSGLAEIESPEVPDGYDGFVTVTVEAFTIGWGYIVEPTLVPYHEGETVAQVTDRLFTTLGIEYIGGTPDETFYLTGVSCPQVTNGIQPAVPEYLMEQLELYPEWAEENLGWSMGGWNGAENGNGMLGEYDFSDLAGWMFAEQDVPANMGAGAVPVQENRTYRWMLTIYGYGMDIGMSDGWGMFPDFDNPAMGVLRSDASELYALIMADERLSGMVSEGGAAFNEFAAFVDAMENLASSQEEIDEAMNALLAAIEVDVIPGDVDGDGSLSTADALMILRSAMQLIVLEGNAFAAADYDGNGSVTVADALVVLRISMGLLN